MAGERPPRSAATPAQARGGVRTLRSGSADHRPATRGPVRGEVLRPPRERVSSRGDTPRTPRGRVAQHERGSRTLRDGTVVRPRPAAQKRSRATTRSRRRRPRLRIPLAASGRRLHVLLIVIGMALSLCAGRLIQLQGFDSSSYSVDALTRTLSLLPARGQITDRNGLVLAATQPAVAVTADPSLTAPRALEIAGVLSAHLGMSTTELMPLLTKPGTRFVYIKKKVPALTYTALATELAKRKVYGVFRENDPIRTYPNSSVGSSVVGFVGADGKGLAGLELKLNSSLAGVEGKQTFQSAPNGSKIPLGETSLTPAKNGVSYQLTLDSEIEWAAQRRVAEMVRKTRADSGFVIVLDVKTGQVLALAHAPSYDSARPLAAKREDRGNRAISAPYEPGSVQKILTAAALFDSGAATPTSRVVVPERLASGGRSIKDHFPHGKLRYNLRGVIANSSNIGAALLTRQLSKQTLHDYLVSFGLGSRTGIELPGESVGIVPPADMVNGQRDQVAFGQAISVTGIQEAAAIAGLVNGGIYHPPTVLKKAYDADGREIAIERRPPRRIISEESSAQVRDVMAAVIDSVNGQRNLSLEGYHTGGKTGTAQRADPECRCYRGYVTSFVGFAPLDDPQLLTYVVITNPRTADTGTTTAGPVYRDVMAIALPRYSVPPGAKPRKPLRTEW